LRRTILHLLQIFFTDAMTFIVALHMNRGSRRRSLRFAYFALNTIRPRVRS
jgi:hypothetical protein